MTAQAKKKDWIIATRKIRTTKCLQAQFQTKAAKLEAAQEQVEMELLARLIINNSSDQIT